MTDFNLCQHFFILTQNLGATGIPYFVPIITLTLTLTKIFYNKQQLSTNYWLPLFHLLGLGLKSTHMYLRMTTHAIIITIKLCVKNARSP